MDTKIYGGKFNKWTEKHKKIQKVTDFCNLTNLKHRTGELIHSSDIKKIDIDLIKQIGSFKNVGFKTIFKVTNVSDGDTFNVGYIKTMKFYQIESTNTGSTKGRRLGISKQKRTDILVHEKCRIDGIDTFEFSSKFCTWEGLCGTIIAKTMIRKNKGILYGELISLSDKYGRSLIRFYFDKNYTKPYNEYLINYNGNMKEIDNYINEKVENQGKKTLILTALNKYRNGRTFFKIATEYDGGKKSAITNVSKIEGDLKKTLLRISNNDQDF